MRLFAHPAAEHITVEGILYALADPVRAAIFTTIAGSDCSRNCSGFLELRDRTVPKSTLSQHFRALREAGLVRGERQGVEVHHTSRCAEVDKRFPGLLAAILAAYHRQQQPRPPARTRAPRKRAS